MLLKTHSKGSRPRVGGKRLHQRRAEKECDREAAKQDQRGDRANDGSAGVTTEQVIRRGKATSEHYGRRHSY